MHTYIHTYTHLCILFIYCAMHVKILGKAFVRQQRIKSNADDAHNEKVGRGKRNGETKGWMRRKKKRQEEGEGRDNRR